MSLKGARFQIVLKTVNQNRILKCAFSISNLSIPVCRYDEVAKPLKYCSLGSFRLSPSHNVLAYSIDPSGYETYEVRF